MYVLLTLDIKSKQIKSLLIKHNIGAWGRYAKDGTPEGMFCKKHAVAALAWLCEGLTADQVAQKLKEREIDTTREMRIASRILDGGAKPFNDETVQSICHLGLKVRSRVAVVFEDDWNLKTGLSLDIEGLPVISEVLGLTGDHDKLIRMLVLDLADSGSFPPDLSWHEGEVFVTVENCHFEQRMSHQQQLRRGQGLKTLQQRGLNDFKSRGHALSIEGLRKLMSWQKVEGLKDAHLQELEAERKKQEAQIGGNAPINDGDDESSGEEDDAQARLLGKSVGGGDVKKVRKKGLKGKAKNLAKPGRSTTPARGRTPTKQAMDAYPSPEASPTTGRVDIEAAPSEAVWRTISPQAILSGSEMVEKRLNGSHQTLDFTSMTRLALDEQHPFFYSERLTTHQLSIESDIK